MTVSSRGDGRTSGTCAGASQTADVGLQVDERSKTRMVLKVAVQGGEDS